MSDLAAATADTQLTPYRGRDVRRVIVKITKAGDSLSESLGIEPIELEMGDRVFVLLEAVVGPHKHKVMPGYEPTEKDAPLVIEMELITQTVTVVDETLAGKPLDAQRERLRVAKDEAKGVTSLPGTIGTGKPGDGWDDEDAEVSNVHQFPATAAPADTCVCADVRDEHEGNGSGPCLVDGCECSYFEAVDPGDDEEPTDSSEGPVAMTPEEEAAFLAANPEVADRLDTASADDDGLVDVDLPDLPTDGDDDQVALDAAALATLNGGETGDEPTAVEAATADPDADSPAAETDAPAETPPPTRKARARK
jgi:hypothetical protein